MIDTTIPYEPVYFAYSYSIGEKDKSTQNIHYQLQYQDILIPQQTNNLINYYLFHIPPIYNWLRTLNIQESVQLNEYITSKSQNNKNKTFNKSDFFSDLTKYIRQFQIVKLCSSLKVYVQKIYPEQNCNHTLKTQQWSTKYFYNPQSKLIHIKQIFCNNCKKYIKGTFNLVTIPYAPIFQRSYGSHITINGDIYDLIIIMSVQTSKIRAASGVWYLIHKENDKKIQMISGNENELTKKGQIFIYLNRNLCVNKNILLKSALPIISIMKETTKSKIKESQAPIQLLQKQIKEKQPFKKIQPLKKSKKYLKPLRKQPNRIILSQENTLNDKYQQKVKQLYQKPQQKDEYDKEYDMGKTKKIKKHREYFKPDFNVVQKQLKQDVDNGVINEIFQKKHNRKSFDKRK